MFAKLERRNVRGPGSTPRPRLSGLAAARAGAHCASLGRRAADRIRVVRKTCGFGFDASIKNNGSHMWGVLWRAFVVEMFVVLGRLDKKKQKSEDHERERERERERARGREGGGSEGARELSRDKFFYNSSFTLSYCSCTIARCHTMHLGSRP